MLKLGIIGYGFMGKTHHRMLLDSFADTYKVVAISEINPQQLETIYDDVKVYEDYRDLLKDDEIDTVIISLPNDLHKESVILAAQHKKHIICEKPVAMSTSELKEMIEAIDQNNVKFTVHQQRRYDIDFRTAKEVYDSNTLGDVFTIQSKLYGFNGNMHDWHVYPEKGGGMLFDWGVHLIDQVMWMVDSKVESVYADLRNVINENVDDYFKILLKFENNTFAEVELGTYFLSDKKDWFERHWFIGGNNGSYYSDGFYPQGKVVKTARLLENVPNKITMTAAGPTRSFGPPADDLLQVSEVDVANTKHTMFFTDYYESRINNTEFFIKKEEVYDVLKVMEAVRTSSSQNRVVYLNQESNEV